MPYSHHFKSIKLVGVGAALIACIGCYFFLRIKKQNKKSFKINVKRSEPQELCVQESIKMPNPNGDSYKYVKCQETLQETEQQHDIDTNETLSETSSDSGQGHSETQETMSTLTIVPNNLSTSSTNNLPPVETSTPNQAAVGPVVTPCPMEHITSIPTQTIDLAVYEFYFPRKLCGKLIGKNGVHVDYIRTKTHAFVAVRNDLTKAKDCEYQIVTVSGKLSEVDEALEILTTRFPAKFYPQISFKPISKPIIYRRKIVDTQKILVTPSMFVYLPPYQVDVHVSAIVSSTHLFIQLPTHPTYNLLQKLDEDMLHLYSSNLTHVPLLNEPVEQGTICAAPTSYGWHRALITHVFENEPQVTVKFLDYGGYLNIPLDQLKPLRNDFMTLPFQAIEVNLDGIEAISTSENEDDKNAIANLIKNRPLKAFKSGPSKNDLQSIKLFIMTENFKSFLVNTELVSLGIARRVQT